MVEEADANADADADADSGDADADADADAGDADAEADAEDDDEEEEDDEDDDKMRNMQTACGDLRTATFICHWARNQKQENPSTAEETPIVCPSSVSTTAGWRPAPPNQSCGLPLGGTVQVEKLQHEPKPLKPPCAWSMCFQIAMSCSSWWSRQGYPYSPAHFCTSGRFVHG